MEKDEKQSRRIELVKQILQCMEELNLDSEDYMRDYNGEDILGQYWGMCPRCWEVGEYYIPRWLNVKRLHFICCHRHKTFWSLGENIFSIWQYESEELWEKNRELLSRYEEVRPVHIGDIFNLMEINRLKQENTHLKKKLRDMIGEDISARDPETPF